MPPVPNGFIAYIHASFMQQVFYISKRERKSHIQHHCKVVYSDKAHRTLGFQKLIFFPDTNYATMVAY